MLILVVFQYNIYIYILMLIVERISSSIPSLVSPSLFFSMWVSKFPKNVECWSDIEIFWKYWIPVSNIVLVELMFSCRVPYRLNIESKLEYQIFYRIGFPRLNIGYQVSGIECRIPYTDYRTENLAAIFGWVFSHRISNITYRVVPNIVPNIVHNLFCTEYRTEDRNGISYRADFRLDLYRKRELYHK